MTRRSRKSPCRAATRPKSPAAAIAAIARALEPTLAYDAEEKLRSRSRRMPVAVVRIVARLAEKHGKIAGTAVDARALRAELARVQESRALAKLARALSRRAASDAVQRYARIADQTMGITMMLSVYVRSDEWAHLREDNAEIRALMRKCRRGA